MRLLALAATLALAAGCSRRAEPSAASASIVRSVRTAAATVALGEPLPVPAAVAPPAPGDTIVTLAPASQGVRGIHAVLTTTGLVRALVLDYEFDADFEAMVADSTASLGRPARERPRRQGEEPTDVAIWRDAATELRLVRDPNRSAWTVRGELLDRRLTGAGRQGVSGSR